LIVSSMSHQLLRRPSKSSSELDGFDDPE
jgi:hypothetical protein